MNSSVSPCPPTLLAFALVHSAPAPDQSRWTHSKFRCLRGNRPASTLCFVLVIHPWAWLIARLIMGASIAGMFVVAESWLNNRASNEVRGTVLAIYIMIGYLAAAIGQQGPPLVESR
ncbi:MAG: hypothetical protein CM1200mP41_36790 [Gammaproteobacteria bacterium]|nr:MAG: hypothetical protein CM1200mP41_36790 [Gammaproteobacteria bacterium]